GHAGHRTGGETHFRVKIISPAFKGLTKLASHRAVYAVLADDMKEGGIHALALDISAPD
ncbi:MAG: BolA family protein, partial [Alphaproteobacteria bacterium]